MYVYSLEKKRGQIVFIHVSRNPIAQANMCSKKIFQVGFFLINKTKSNLFFVGFPFFFEQN